jgi:hypothetical protein
MDPFQPLQVLEFRLPAVEQLQQQIGRKRLAAAIGAFDRRAPSTSATIRASALSAARAVASRTKAPPAAG